jgi:hypothetical protein
LGFFVVACTFGKKEEKELEINEIAFEFTAHSYKNLRFIKYLKKLVLNLK